MADFRMPSLGADMVDGTLVEWLVRPGDPVHRGDVVAVVDTDKAAIDAECFEDGVVQEIVVEPGRRVPVGTVLARIAAHDGAPVPPPPVTAPPRAALVSASPAAPPTPPVPPPAAQPRVRSPLVRHLAERQGLDITHLHGSGPGGLVHRKDVEPAAPRRRAATGAPVRRRVSPYARRLAAELGVDVAAATASRADGPVRAADIRQVHAARQAVPVPAPAPPLAQPATVPAGAPRGDRGAGMRAAIAALMARSNAEIPHYYVSATVDMGPAAAWLRERNRDLPVAERLVPAALLMAATARAAREVPQLNGTWVDGSFIPASSVALGLVVSLRSGGILVPVIHDAAARSVEQLMVSLRDLVARARTGRLRGSELAPPSITVTNLGDQGVEAVFGVIYPPQVALVGFGAIVERPWAVGGLLGVRPVVTATLAADHRASDGATGARFLNRINRLLIHPEEL